MEIGKMLNDIRDVLVPQIPVGQIARQFEGDLRAPNAQNPITPKQPQAQPSDSLGWFTDKPTNHAPMFEPIPLKNATPSEETVNSALDGTMHVYGDRFRGGVTQSQYDQFVTSRGAFQEMLDEWTKTDDPVKRIGIINQYNDKYGFASNLILSDLAEELWRYDSAQARGKEAPDGTWTLENRQEWKDWALDNMDYAAMRYDPRKRITRA